MVGFGTIGTCGTVEMSGNGMDAGMDLRVHVGRWWVVGVLLVIVVAGMGVRAWRFGDEQVWADEVSSLMPLGKASLGEMFTALRFVDPPAMPVYFVALEWLGRPFDYRPGAARVFSLAWAAGSLVMMYLVGRRLLGRGAGLAAAGVLAFSVMHVYYSLEIRPYSLLLFLELVSIYALVRALLPGGQRAWWVAHGAANALMLFTHATSLLFLVVEGLFLLTFYWQRWRVWSLWGVWHGACFGLMVLWLRLARIEKIQEAAAYMQKPGWGQVKGEVLKLASLDELMRSTWPWYLAICAGVLMVAALGALIFWRRSGDTEGAEVLPRRQAGVLLLYWMVVPVGIIVAASYLGRPCFQIRYALGSSLAIAVAFGSVVTLVRWRGVQVLLAALVMVVFGQQAHVRLEKGPMRGMVWTGLREYLEGGMTEKDGLFVFFTQSYLKPGFMMACDVPVEPEVKKFLCSGDVCAQIKACHEAGRAVWIVRLRGQADPEIESCLGGNGMRFESRAFPEIDYWVYHCPAGP